MNHPHFTIVIPTRNRLGSFKHTIKTCLNQNYKNFSIIVASNNCTDGTNEYVSSLADPRIILLQSDVDLSMTLNWSRVMPHAISLGGYVTYLGDDDGLLPGALSIASEIISVTRCKALSWRKVEYAWPDMLMAEYRNYFSISIDSVVAPKKSDEFLAKIHSQACGYDEGPGLYSSFVSADVLEEVLSETDGVWFSSGYPDIYSCYVIASAVDSFYRCGFGLSINGASGKSTGTAYMHVPQSELVVEFNNQNSLHEPLSHAPSLAIAEADALLYARGRLPGKFSPYEFSWPLLVNRLSEEISSAPTKYHFDRLLAALQNIVEFSDMKMPEVPGFSEGKNTKSAQPLYGIDFEAKRISLNLQNLRVENVFDASQFSDSIFPLARLRLSDILVEPEDNPGVKDSPVRVEEIEIAPKGRLEYLKRPLRPMVRRLRKYSHWIRNLNEIEDWISRDNEIRKWIANSSIFDAAIKIQSEQAEKERLVRGDFDDFRRLSNQIGDGRFSIDWKDRYLCLDENSKETAFDRHYIYHPAWAARALAKISPKRHTDISSTLQFCTIVSAFVPVDFYDYRPAALQLSDLNSLEVDLVKLPFPNESINSLSCMHVLEHVGLGRYGDPLDPLGDLKAIKELSRVLSPGGDLLIVVPVGAARIQYNAHRVYGHREFLSHFNELDLFEFALIPDGAAPNGLIYSAPDHLVDAQQYGCGCYWFKKPARLN